MSENHEQDDEELVDEFMNKKPKKLFSYNWQKGFISPYLATSSDIVNLVLHVIRPQPSQVLIDLGCGDGRFVIESAKIYHNKGIGVDLDEALLQIANKKAIEEQVFDLVTFKNENLISTNISEANFVIIFLLPSKSLKNLIEKLREYILEKDIVVVSMSSTELIVDSNLMEYLFFNFSYKRWPVDDLLTFQEKIIEIEIEYSKLGFYIYASNITQDGKKYIGYSKKHLEIAKSIKMN